MIKNPAPRQSVALYLDRLRKIGLHETHEILVYPLRIRNVGEKIANKNVSDLWLNIATKFKF